MFQIYKESLKSISPKMLQAGLNAIDSAKSFHSLFAARYQSPIVKIDYPFPIIIMDEKNRYGFGLKTTPNIFPLLYWAMSKEHIMFFNDDGSLKSYTINGIFSNETNKFYLRQPLYLEFDSNCNLVHINYRYWCRLYSTDSVVNFVLSKDSSMLGDFEDELILIELFRNYNNPFLEEIFPEYHNHGAWVFDIEDIHQRLELLRLANY